MPEVSCPNCGQAFAIPADQWPQYRGRSIDCTGCGQRFAVDPAQPAPVSPQPPLPAAAPPRVAVPASAGAAAPKNRKRKSRLPLILIIAALLIGGAVTGFIVKRRRDEEKLNRLRCQQNLREIFAGLTQYTSQYNDFLPPHLSNLSGWLKPSQLICPDDKKNTPFADNAALDQMGPNEFDKQFSAALQAGGHCSYVYAREGNSTRATSLESETILFYEPLDDHADGSNFLNVVGIVTWLPRDQAAPLIASLQHGESAQLPAPPPAPAPVATVPGWVVHEGVAQESLVSIETPPEWEERAPIGKAAVSVTPHFGPAKPSDPTIYVMCISTGRVDATAADYLPEYLKTYQPGFKLLTSEPVQVNGRPGVRAVGKPIESLKLELLMVVKGEYAFIFRYQCGEEQFDKIGSVIDRAARTLKVQ